ncbi:hypothetical protein CTRI78_v005386 [Colletotrichum trifolii]|uniref:Mitochondrial inner membrane protein COX18 n=1 Tax=Colletotrichum trifolii TaxID=5466 RepID=A0A4R8REV0_COLTR|nr:hypothetical protein CTRI78_v005386 [Colletotrichum trifolii]
MASLRAARIAFPSRWHQAPGISAGQFRASIRPHISPKSSQISQRTSGCRNFSLIAVAESSVQATQDFIYYAHGALGGAPASWFLVFPGFAMLFAISRFPLQAYSAMIVKRQIEAKPLTSAWTQYIRRYPPGRRRHVYVAINRVLKERRAQAWKTYTPQVVGFPLWLLGTESVRRVCGASGGLLSLITGGYATPKQEALDSAAPALEQTATALASTVDAANESLQVAASNLDMCWLGLDLAAPAPWFLPVALSAVLISGIYPKNPAVKELVFDITGKKLADALPASRRSARFTRILLCFGLIGPLACCQMPAALFFYWIPSVLTTQALTKYSAITKHETPSTTTPCRRRVNWTLQ